MTNRNISLKRLLNYTFCKILIAGHSRAIGGAADKKDYPQYYDNCERQSLSLSISTIIVTGR